MEKYLRQCLDSVINQTLKDIQIICVDDGSTDDSLIILKEYALKDDRIIIIESEKNLGTAIARNKGLKIATGEYYGFIDPDDEIDLNYYDVLYNAAKQYDVDVVKGEMKTIYYDKNEKISTLNDKIKNNNSLIYYFLYEWTTAIYRASFIRQNNICFPNECRKAQDSVFLARVVFKHATFHIIFGVYYHYHTRPGSLDSNIIPINSIKSALIANGLVLDEINNSNLYIDDNKLYNELYLNRLLVIFRTLFQNKTFEAKKMCAKALINQFYMCKNIEYPFQSFPYPYMLNYIKRKDIKGLARHLAKYKNRITNQSNSSLSKKYKWYQRIFSVSNRKSKNKSYKVICILGIRINLKL